MVKMKGRIDPQLKKYKAYGNEEVNFHDDNLDNVSFESALDEFIKLTPE